MKLKDCSQFSPINTPMPEETFKACDNNMDKYLRPTFTIDSDHEQIMKCANTLTENCANDREKTVKLFYFVRDSIPYNLYMISVFKDDFKASRIFEWGKAYCVQKAVLLTALGRAAGVPSRLIFARIRNYKLPDHVREKNKGNVFHRHGYNQFYIDGKWVSAAATFHKDLCDDIGVPAVEFDGRSEAILPEKDLMGEPYIEYIEKFSPSADLPFEWIRQKISKIVGNDKRPWLQKGVSDENNQI